MIKIEFGVSKHKVETMVANAYEIGFEHGEEFGENAVLDRLRNRIELLNLDFPVTVQELRGWVGLTKDGK